MKILSTLGHLALALLNATLILAAIVLWLGWRTAETVQEVSEDYAEYLTPLRTEVRQTNDQIAALRADIAALRTGADGTPPALPADLVARLDRLDARIAVASDRIEQLAATPDALIDHAIDTAADGLSTAILAFRTCTPPGDG